MAAFRKLVTNTNALLSTLILIGVLGIANYLAQRNVVDLDLSENKQYTLSDSTKSIIENLDDVVNVKIFLTGTLPPEYVNTENRVRDLFKDLVSYADGKLRVQFIDPGDDPELQEMAERFAVPRVPISAQSREKSVLTNGYIGIGFQYGDKIEQIPVIQPQLLGDLEYEVVSRLYKMTAENLETIGFLVGHQGPDIYNDAEFGLYRRQLETEYRVTMVDLTKGGDVPPEVTTLVVAGLKTILKEREKFEIDQFIMRGGHCIFFLDPIRFERGLQAIPQPTNLDDLLTHYGVRVSRDLVIDTEATWEIPFTFTEGTRPVPSKYPFWPHVMKSNFNTTNTIVNKLESLTLPWCSPLRLLTVEIENVAPTEPEVEVARSADQEDGQQGENPEDAKPFGFEQGGSVTGVKGIVLATTTPSGSVVTSPFNLDPRQKFEQEETTRVPLAIALVGSFSSFYKDRDIPKPLTGKEKDEGFDLSMLTQGPQPTNEKREPILEQSPESQIIVVGNSQFALAQNLGQFPGNNLFAMNCVDWTTQRSQLIDIRSRAVIYRPLKTISSGKQTMVLLLNIFGVSLFVIMFGLGRFYFRRKAKHMDTEPS